MENIGRMRRRGETPSRYPQGPIGYGSVPSGADRMPSRMGSGQTYSNKTTLQSRPQPMSTPIETQETKQTIAFPSKSGHQWNTINGRKVQIY